MASRCKPPLRAFRIADQRHPLLDGTGAFLQGGRWTSKGRRVIYAAETYAGALLEMLVHANLRRLPRTLAWVEIRIPSGLDAEEIKASRLPGWNGMDLSVCRALGDAWQEEKRSPLLLVPSVVTQGVERNVLLNQDHPAFSSFVAGPPALVEWDARLLSRAPAAASAH